MESQETAEVQELEDEETIIRAATGEPFATEKSAKMALKKRGLTLTEYFIRRVQNEEEDGWVIEKRPTFEEKYYRVMFAARSNPNDPPDVTLSVNGEKIVIAREKEVVIPGRYKECADNAKWIKWTQEPNKPRKIIGSIQRYPYTLVGPATEQEFLKNKAEGTEKTKKAIARFGYDVTPEQLDE